jgi:hypothetical protein
LRCSHWCPVDERKKRWLSTIYAERATMAKESCVGKEKWRRWGPHAETPECWTWNRLPPGFWDRNFQKTWAFFCVLSAWTIWFFLQRDGSASSHACAREERERERVSSSTETRDGRWEKTDGGWPRNKLVYPPFPVSRHKSINMMHFFPLP